MEKLSEKKVMSITTEKDSEKFVLKKRTEKEEVTKTIEKISNGWLLTVDKYPFDGEGEYSCVKKYLDKNPLGVEEEEDDEEMGSEMESFKESWDILN